MGANNMYCILWHYYATCSCSLIEQKQAKSMHWDNYREWSYPAWRPLWKSTFQILLLICSLQFSGVRAGGMVTFSASTFKHLLYGKQIPSRNNLHSHRLMHFMQAYFSLKSETVGNVKNSRNFSKTFTDF